MKRSKLLFLGTIVASAILISFNSYSAPLKEKPDASTDLFHPKRIVEAPEAPEDQPFAEHFAVFHISTGDGYAQTLVLNNAQNLQNFYGADKVAIEVVTYGPGLRTLFEESTNSNRIKRMADSGITFSACANTMRAMGRETESLNNAAKLCQVVWFELWNYRRLDGHTFVHKTRTPIEISAKKIKFRGIKHDQLNSFKNHNGSSRYDYHAVCDKYTGSQLVQTAWHRARWHESYLTGVGFLATTLRFG